MIDTTTSKGKLIAAALELAKSRPWHDVSMLDIADAAGLPLDEVRRAFGSKSQVLAGFMRAVDDALAGATRMATDLPGVVSQTLGALFRRPAPSADKPANPDAGMV